MEKSVKSKNIRAKVLWARFEEHSIEKGWGVSEGGLSDRDAASFVKLSGKCRKSKRPRSIYSISVKTLRQKTFPKILSTQI